ncbi:MAG: DsrE family protein [Cyclobacteriaceae bacterium]
MKFILSFSLALSVISMGWSQRIHPIIKNHGGIFDIPYADEKADPNLQYNIVIEVERGSVSPDSLNWALNNVARLINLHATAGVKKENLNVVLAIHGGAAYTVMDNEAYHKKYKTSNPNVALYEELSAAGVTLFVCGQSLIARKIDRTRMLPNIKVATSMLTTVTTHQLRGYSYLRF